MNIVGNLGWESCLIVAQYMLDDHCLLMTMFAVGFAEVGPAAVKRIAAFMLNQ